MKTRIAAAEARCGPEQTNNDERRAQVLQIPNKIIKCPVTGKWPGCTWKATAGGYRLIGQFHFAAMFPASSCRVTLISMRRRRSATEESRMKLNHRYAFFAIAVVLFAAGIAMFSTRAGAQDEGWQIVRAEYGTKSQHNDVTDIVKDLIGRGGVNGRVAVNNQTMGGDPAVGADKHLRIFARNRRHEEREFDYKEGGFIEVRTFNVRPDDFDDRQSNSGGQYQDDSSGLRVVRAYYGVQGRTVNVTELLRSRVQNGALSFVVTNSAFGGDPAPGYDKLLIVVYRYQGTESATAVREGNTLSLP